MKDKRQRVSNEWTSWVLSSRLHRVDDLQTHTVVLDTYLVCFIALFLHSSCCLCISLPHFLLTCNSCHLDPLFQYLHQYSFGTDLLRMTPQCFMASHRVHQ